MKAAIWPEDLPAIFLGNFDGKFNTLQPGYLGSMGQATYIG
jgi:hypothetical protein